MLVISDDEDGDGDVEEDERYYIVIDTGHWSHIRKVSDEFLSLIPEDEKIDMMFLTHPDSDHIAATAKLVEKRRVDTIIRTGFQRPWVGT